jgi:LacI family transcriptional regulator
VAKKPLKPITLKEFAATLQLSQSTVSRIVNGGAVAHRIAAETQQRVLHAAVRYGYSANAVARSLRQKRTFTIGVMVPEISDIYSTAVLGGIEDELLKAGFFYFVVSHRHRADLLEGHTRMMLARAVEGIIAIDSMIEDELPVPLVSVSGRKRSNGVIRIELNHKRAALLALEHLKKLGHKHIAFIRGQEFRPDSKQRWQSILEMARTLDLAIDPQLVMQLRGPGPGPASGSEVTQELLKTRRIFTAICACNDVTAMGAMLALREAGLRVPKDVSIVGFDDVLIATTSNPPLTTIHQPLRSMGQAAATTLLGLIRDEIPRPHPSTITVHPNLVVRRSTSSAAL